MGDFLFKTQCTIMISGPTGCGKSSLVWEISKRLSESFDRPPKRLVYCYSRYQPLYDEMKKNSPIPAHFIEGLPKDLKLSPRTLLVIDDLQGADNSCQITDFFTKNSHHFDVDVIYLCQNLFLNTPHHRTCNLNTHVLIIFKTPRDKMQKIALAKQISPNNNKFI